VLYTLYANLYLCCAIVSSASDTCYITLLDELSAFSFATCLLSPMPLFASSESCLSKSCFKNIPATLRRLLYFKSRLELRNRIKIILRSCSHGRWCNLCHLKRISESSVTRAARGAYGLKGSFTMLRVCDGNRKAYLTRACADLVEVTA